MVEAEEEYTEQMEVLVSCFLRPFKMAASSKKPPCSHEDVNSIFLNSETVLFLHQIFLKGLTSRMESWPTLVLGMNKHFLLSLFFTILIYNNFIKQFCKKDYILINHDVLNVTQVICSTCCYRCYRYIKSTCVITIIAFKCWLSASNHHPRS